MAIPMKNGRMKKSVSEKMFENILGSIDFWYWKLYNWSRKYKRAECACHLHRKWGGAYGTSSNYKQIK